MALVGSFFGHQTLVEAQRYGAQILHARDACPEPTQVFLGGVMASQATPLPYKGNPMVHKP